MAAKASRAHSREAFAAIRDLKLGPVTASSRREPLMPGSRCHGLEPGILDDPSTCTDAEVTQSLNGDLSAKVRASGLRCHGLLLDAMRVDGGSGEFLSPKIGRASCRERV